MTLSPDQKDRILEEIVNLEENFIYFLQFLENVTNILEDAFGRNSVQVNRFLNIQERYLNRNFNIWKIFGTLDNELINETFGEVKSELIAYLRTLL